MPQTATPNTLVLCNACDCEEAVTVSGLCLACATISCTECGGGQFFHVATRQFPTLCLDCADHADRSVNGWTPANSCN